MDEQQHTTLTHGITSRPQNPNQLPKWVRLLLIALGAILLVLVVMFWRSEHQVKKLQDSLDNKVNATKIAEENKALIDQVGTHIILPTDETPTIATVSDLDKLENQPFFAHAELGDKVLIYAKAKKAILFRPSSNQIVELAPLTDSGEPASNNSNSASGQ